MKLHCYLIGAEVLQTLRQLDFLLVNLDTMLFLAGSCNLFGGYRTEGSSALSCLDLDHDLLGLQLGLLILQLGTGILKLRLDGLDLFTGAVMSACTCLLYAMTSPTMSMRARRSERLVASSRMAM